MARVGSNYIGTYRRLKMLRQGKTCQIWETMASNNERCILKVLREEFRKDKNEMAMLKHEYVVGSELDHENCIRAYEYDVIRGIPFVAIEYFQNSINLKQWIREPDIKREWLPSIIEQSAKGIIHLHSKGWIHRDLKPDNLLVDDKGSVKLIDFAIAQKAKKGLGRLLGGKMKVAGTRSYMSPEQIRNETLDPRSDIYSLGCLIFEICSGKLPFTGISSDDLLQRHLKSPVPSLTAFSDDVNPTLGKLVERMMAKKREDRPETVESFLHEFKKIRLPFGRPK